MVQCLSREGRCRDAGWALLLAALTSACAASAREPAPDGVRIATQVGEVMFRDSPACDVALCVRHDVRGEVGGRYVVIKREGTDGDGTYIVDRTSGEVRQLNAPPLFNPSQTVFVTSSLDEMNDTADSGGLFVWGFDDTGRLTVLRHVRFEEFAVDQVLGWANDRCIDVSGFRGWGSGQHSPTGAASLRMDDQMWRLLSDSCRTSEGN